MCCVETVVDHLALGDAKLGRGQSLSGNAEWSGDGAFSQELVIFHAGDGGGRHNVAIAQG